MTVNIPVISSWKSTVTGLLSFLTTTGLVLLGTGSTILTPVHMRWVTLGLALARAYMALITTDADKLTSADIYKATAVANGEHK